MMGRFTIGRMALKRTNPDNSSTIPAKSLNYSTTTHPSKIIAKTKETIKIESDNTLDAINHHTKNPGSKGFSQLKSEEHKLFYHRRRARSNYSDNYSAALALPYSSFELEKKQNDRNALLVLSRDSIIEHANRRVDLFFYTLIAYYQTGIIPTIGHTSLQHGRGRTVLKEGSDFNLTQACHSSFTPSLVDETIYQTNPLGGKNKSLLSGTHLMDSLNSTVELPPFVNKLDDVLESMCRQKSLELIGKTSLGSLNPINGLTAFLKMMRSALTELKQSASRQARSALVNHSLSGQNHINPQLINLVMRGTLHTTYLPETESVSDEYIQLLLRLKPEEKALCERDKETRITLYLDKIADLQKEILEAKSECSNSAS